MKDREVAAYEKSRKKKDPDLDRSKIQVRLPDTLLERIVQAALSSPACMNKGFILDGFPRHLSNAQNVFLEPVPDYVAPEEPSEDPFAGLEKIEAIAP